MSTPLSSRTVSLHRLTYVDEEDGVTVGRPDTGSYAVLPSAGADLLRALEHGEPFGTASARYTETTGEQLDEDDFHELLLDLGFLRDPGDPVTSSTLRWQRFGRAAFSPAAWAGYFVVIGAGLVAIGLDPALRPSYRLIFFTSQLTLIPILIAAGQIPCMLIHESFHMLAGRRLGLPSTLGIGRRYYYIVAETRMDALYSVPRRQRYLPFLAGMLIDLVLAGAFTLVAAATRHAGGPDVVAGFALAMAFTSLTRVLWQGLFYLETDLHFVIATASRCADLQGAARYTARRWRSALLRRPAPTEEAYGERDLACARWYTPLMAVGYAISTASLVFIVIPTSVHFWSTVWQRLTTPVPVAVLIDTIAFIILTLAQTGLFAYVGVRDYRTKRRARRTASEGVTP